MKHLPNGQRVYADSTMKRWTKKEFIKYVRMCERNVTALAERVENQAKFLKDMLAIDAAPVVHGHWNQVDETKCRCSNCDIIALIGLYPHGDKNFCPNCGAKMDGVK